MLNGIPRRDSFPPFRRTPLGLVEKERPLGLLVLRSVAFDLAAFNMISRKIVSRQRRPIVRRPATRNIAGLDFRVDPEIIRGRDRICRFWEIYALGTILRSDGRA